MTVRKHIWKFDCIEKIRYDIENRDIIEPTEVSKRVSGIRQYRENRYLEDPLCGRSTVHIVILLD